MKLNPVKDVIPSRENRPFMLLKIVLGSDPCPAHTLACMTYKPTVKKMKKITKKKTIETYAFAGDKKKFTFPTDTRPFYYMFGGV